MCEIDIVSVLAKTLDETEVLTPLNRCAYALYFHVFLPLLFRGLCGILCTHGRSGHLHCFHDVVVASTAADIAFKPGPYLSLCGIWMFLQEVGRRHDHARRTEAALQPVRIAERGLQRMQTCPFREPFDGCDTRPILLYGKHRARLHRVAVHMHNTGAA